MALTLTTVARARRKAAFAAINSDVISDFLTAAQDWVESYCDRKFDSANYSGIYNGHGGRTLFLKHRPVTALLSASIEDDAGSVETLDISTDLEYEAANGAVRFGPNNVSSYNAWPEGFQNITITYTAGYSTIPDAVQEAVILRALVMFSTSGENMNAALVSQQVGEGSKNRVTPYIVDGWMKDVYALLGPYCRMEVG